MAEPNLPDYATKVDDTVTAKVHDGLLELEGVLQGAVQRTEVDVLGKTFVFEPLSEMWETWASLQAEQPTSMLNFDRVVRAPMVAASMAGMKDKDGSLIPVTDMFVMDTKDESIPKEVRSAYQTNAVVRERWARMQLLNWLRSGSGPRSAMNGDVVFKMYDKGVVIAQRAQAEALGQLDPFFGLGTDGDSPSSDGSDAGESSQSSDGS